MEFITSTVVGNKNKKKLLQCLESLTKAASNHLEVCFFRSTLYRSCLYCPVYVLAINNSSYNDHQFSFVGSKGVIVGNS